MIDNSLGSTSFPDTSNPLRIGVKRSSSLSRLNFILVFTRDCNGFFDFSTSNPFAPHFLPFFSAAIGSDSPPRLSLT